MRIHVVPGDELPIYRQIMRQIKDAVAGGRLGIGEQLPSQREMAVDLVISPLTVKKAYDELEREGVIQTRRGRGTFVGPLAQQADLEGQRQRLRGAARRLLSEAHIAGIPLDEVQKTLAEVAQELASERAESREDTSARSRRKKS
jgi:GntR family transcriptional regulator